MLQRPYVSFAEVKAKVPLPDVLDTFGIRQRFTPRGETLTGVCPLPGHVHCSRPNPEQFKIDCKRRLWVSKCFGDCQRGGDVVEFVKAMTGVDNAHVRFWFVDHLAERLTLCTPKKNGQDTKGACGEAAKQPPQTPTRTVDSIPLSSTLLKPLRFFLELDPSASYLKKRCLEPATIARYGLGLCRKGTLAGYVAIPLFRFPRAAGENPVAYLGRWPGEDYDEEKGRPRYKVPAGFETSRVVYGLAEALENSPPSAPLIIVEGAFKVYHLVQCGFPSAVSCLTASFSDEQAAILASTQRPIVLFFDGNDTGREGMRRRLERLALRSFVRSVSLPDKIDPDNLSREGLASLLRF